MLVLTFSVNLTFISLNAWKENTWQLPFSSPVRRAASAG
jgi:hypothetical protein